MKESASKKNGTGIQEKIPFLEGRPKREYGLNKDDLIDLVIALETSEDLLDFINDRHIFP